MTQPITDGVVSDDELAAKLARLSAWQSGGFESDCTKDETLDPAFAAMDRAEDELAS